MKYIINPNVKELLMGFLLFIEAMFDISNHIIAKIGANCIVRFVEDE